MKKKLWCVGLNEFKKLYIENKWDKKVPDNIAIISIISSKDIKEKDEIHLCNEASNVLNLDFDDASPVSYLNEIDATSETYEMQDGKVLQFFTPDMANKVLEFIKKNKGRDFYVHCNAGISRSQAIVRFMLNNIRYNGWETNPNNPCMYPNGFVYQKLMEAYRTIYLNINKNI